MFRHETPQAGRYRQFWQVDVEAVGLPGPDVDAELIALSARLWQRLGISGLKLEINSLGTPESRRAYRAQLLEYLRASRVAAGCRQPAAPGRQSAAHPGQQEPGHAGADRAARRVLTEHLDPESRAHFEALCAHAAGRWASPTRSTRAWCAGSTTTTARCSSGSPQSTGAQNAVCSGGRYDGLIAQLGGDATPAVGFAMGVERLVALLTAAGSVPPRRPARMSTWSSAASGPPRRALAMVERLRSRAAAAAVRAEPRRGQLQGPVPPCRPQRRAPGADHRRGRARPRRGRDETFARASRVRASARSRSSRPAVDAALALLRSGGRWG